MPAAREEKMEAATPAEIVIDVDRISTTANSRSSEEAKDGDSEEEIVCRICHFGPERELMHLGCACRGGLSLVHSRCALRWFIIRGRSHCEICRSKVNKIFRAAEGRSREEGRHNYSRDGRRRTVRVPNRPNRIYRPNPTIILEAEVEDHDCMYTRTMVYLVVFVLVLLLGVFS